MPDESTVVNDMCPGFEDAILIDDAGSPFDSSFLGLLRHSLFCAWSDGQGSVNNALKEGGGARHGRPTNVLRYPTEHP